MSDNMNKVLTKMFHYSYEEIVESLPIGTLVFRMVEADIQIITINDRLLKFANIVRNYVEHDDDLLWDKNTLYAVFKKNIYAFANDEDVPKVKNLVKEAAALGYAQATFRLRGTHGENLKWIKTMCSSKLLEDKSRIFFCLFLDSTNQVLYERQLLDKQKELEYISLYDTLTKVCNRYSYNKFLEESKNNINRNTGILFSDMNGLKLANDEFGHNFGDSIIIAYAEILLKYFPRDCIYRISGDEFIVIQNNVKLESFEANVKLLLAEVNEHNMAAVGYKWETTVVDMKLTIYQTEQLMMIEKQKYYINCDTKKSRHRPKILDKLLADIKNERFMVYLQPKAAVSSSRVIGAEALIRKRDETGRIIPPFEFIPILEKELLISKIDFFVLEEVCRLLQKWQDEGRRLIKISVNMSRITIVESDFLQHIVEICDKYAVDYSCLEFEITESTETRDNRKMLEYVRQLHRLGFGISLDDMGSDYSSLKMVTIEDVDVVKIDRGLVLHINEVSGAALIRYIIALCHELGKKCIAEGVEDEAVADILAGMNCDYYQGYLLNKPIPIEEFEQYLND